MIGHEGSGSLHSFLKKRGWVTELSAAAQPLGRGFDIIRAVIQVTPFGLGKRFVELLIITDWLKEHWRDIVVAYFQYVLMLKNSPLPSYLFDELRTLSVIRFAYRDKVPGDAFTRALSSSLQRPYPLHQILTAPSILYNWDEEKVRKTLDLLDVRKCRVIVSAKNLDGLVSEASWNKEKWYGTAYRVEALGPELVSKCLQRIDSMDYSIPRPNQFIPTNLHVDRISVQPINVCSNLFMV